ncbi:TetR family transcriptional regulator [Lactobacillus helsingborgensis]|uniref:TetR/AcrR family transcriptional regulator n=1 Tax=Lactobacillus helsingborgensis TaxID=1218494 RepID=UPI002741EE9C|nr:TetR family transcriptional regulator [Lactobacillus helsingborgensis]WLT00180.1 TetR family transcriptional regulator [Lactobacillus helsingborgensis]
MYVLSPQEKAAKKQLIAAAASKLFQKNDFNKISMARIARESGVAKGTLFNYFRTKESIFMYLLLSGYQDYLKDVLLRFQAAENITTWAAFSSFLLEQNHLLISERPDLLRLNALRGPILETAADKEQTLLGRKKLYQVNHQLGQAIAKRINILDDKQASHLFIIQSAIISGLMNMMNLDEFHHDQLPVDFKGFQIDLEQEANQLMLFYLQGLAQKLGGAK